MSGLLGMGNINAPTQRADANKPVPTTGCAGEDQGREGDGAEAAAMHEVKATLISH